MTLLCLLCATLAFLLFGLSTDEHHLKQLGHKPTAAWRKRLRRGAWFWVVAAFPLGVAAMGWIFGPVLWAAALMLGAGIVFVGLNFLPERKAASAPKKKT